MEEKYLASLNELQAKFEEEFNKNYDESAPLYELNESCKRLTELHEEFKNLPTKLLSSYSFQEDGKIIKRDERTFDTEKLPDFFDRWRELYNSNQDRFIVIDTLRRNKQEQYDENAAKMEELYAMIESNKALIDSKRRRLATVKAMLEFKEKAKYRKYSDVEKESDRDEIKFIESQIAKIESTNKEYEAQIAELGRMNEIIMLGVPNRNVDKEHTVETPTEEDSNLLNDLDNDMGNKPTEDDKGNEPTETETPVEEKPDDKPPVEEEDDKKKTKPRRLKASVIGKSLPKNALLRGIGAVLIGAAAFLSGIGLNRMADKLGTLADKVNGNKTIENNVNVNTTVEVQSEENEQGREVTDTPSNETNPEEVKHTHTTDTEKPYTPAEPEIPSTSQETPSAIKDNEVALKEGDVIVKSEVKSDGTKVTISVDSNGNKVKREEKDGQTKVTNEGKVETSRYEFNGTEYVKVELPEESKEYENMRKGVSYEEMTGTEEEKANAAAALLAGSEEASNSVPFGLFNPVEDEEEQGLSR